MCIRDRRRGQRTCLASQVIDGSNATFVVQFTHKRSIHPFNRSLVGSPSNASATVDRRKLKPGRSRTPVVNVQPQRRSIGNLYTRHPPFYGWVNDCSTARGKTCLPSNCCLMLYKISAHRGYSIGTTLATAGEKGIPLHGQPTLPNRPKLRPRLAYVPC